jgi:predicted esterase|tara:strand:- start:1968 stop:2612 length:645 start_codon:yes stop_codon:yes gene_type:complete
MKIDTINPEFNHLKTVIFLHSLNQSQTEIHHITNCLKTEKRGLKIIIPHADEIDISWSNGICEKVNSWYNYYTWNDNLYKHDSINIKQFCYNSSIIKNLIEKEAEIIDPQKIFVIGMSQGGTIAIDTCLKLSFRIKKVICIDTIFLDTYFEGNYSKQTFTIFQSIKDKVYNPIFQDMCYKKLTDNNCKVIKNKYNYFHTENLSFILKFINSNIA